VAVVVVATITPKDGLLDEVVEVFRQKIPEVHNEEGCLLYALHRSKDKIVMVERWETPEALGAHGKGATMASINAGLKGKVAGPPDIVVTEAVPAGDTAKGAV
jgi:quinol monooxygenase YgiN